MDLLLVFALLLFAGVLLSSLANRTVAVDGGAVPARRLRPRRRRHSASCTSSPTTSCVSGLAELALFSVLSPTACGSGFSELRSAWRLPGRALVLGLPLTLRRDHRAGPLGRRAAVDRVVPRRRRPQPDRPGLRRRHRRVGRRSRTGSATCSTSRAASTTASPCPSWWSCSPPLGGERRSPGSARRGRGSAWRSGSRSRCVAIRLERLPLLLRHRRLRAAQRRSPSACIVLALADAHPRQRLPRRVLRRHHHRHRRSPPCERASTSSASWSPSCSSWPRSWSSGR